MSKPETCERCGRPVLRFAEDYDGPIGPHGVLVISHAYYGCDTGCCGLEAVFLKEGKAGGGRVEFSFMHDEAELVKFLDRTPRYAATPKVFTHWHCYDDGLESPHPATLEPQHDTRP